MSNFLMVSIFVKPKMPKERTELKSARILGVALLPQNFEQDRGNLTKFSPFNKGDGGGTPARKQTLGVKDFHFISLHLSRLASSDECQRIDRNERQFLLLRLGHQ